MRLARSAFPRWGADERNSGRTAATGPRRFAVTGRFDLSSAGPRHTGQEVYSHTGITVRGDGALVILYGGRLVAVSPPLSLLWAFDAVAGADGRVAVSPPVVLEDDSVLFTAGDRLVRLDRDGRPVRMLVCEQGPFDDSGLAPAVIPTAGPGPEAALTTPGGFLLHLTGGALVQIPGFYGFDIVPPAVYPDGSLAVAGYHGPGLCRTRTDGTILWEAAPRTPDLLPALNRDGVAAAGSLNEGLTAFVAADGSELGAFFEPCVCSELDAGSWILRGERTLARVTSFGKVLWKRSLPEADGAGGPGLAWGRAQVTVDAAGGIYVHGRDGVRLYTEEGDPAGRFRCPDRRLSAFAVVGAGKAAAIVGGELLLFG